MPTLTHFCLLKPRRFLSEIADFRRKIVYLKKIVGSSTTDKGMNFELKIELRLDILHRSDIKRDGTKMRK